jgi:hypothetical protein
MKRFNFAPELIAARAGITWATAGFDLKNGLSSVRNRPETQI